MCTIIRTIQDRLEKQNLSRILLSYTNMTDKTWVAVAWDYGYEVFEEAKSLQDAIDACRTWLTVDCPKPPTKPVVCKVAHVPNPKLRGIQSIPSTAVPRLWEQQCMVVVIKPTKHA